MTDPRIPDAISQQSLAELLQGRTAMPAVAFDHDHPCELGFLIALFVQHSEGRGPSKSHLAHALMCLVMTLQHHVSRQAAEAVAAIRSPKDALYPIYLTQLVGLLKQMEGIGESILDAFHNQYDVTFDGSVSDAFLASIGMSREDYEDFKAQTPTEER